MSDFAPGDVVVCRHVRPYGTRWDNSLTRLRAGHYYRVTDTGRDGYGDRIVWLDGIASSHPNRAWRATRFRKIRPASDEFTRQMRACRPVKQTEPAQ